MIPAVEMAGFASTASSSPALEVIVVWTDRFVFWTTISSSGETERISLSYSGKIAADVGDVVMWNERRIELFDSRSSKKRKLSSIRRLRICFAASEALDIADSGSDAVEGRLTGGYFDFANVWLLLSHANRWSCRHDPLLCSGLLPKWPSQQHLIQCVKRRIILRDLCCIVLRTQHVSSNEESRQQLGR